MVLLSFSAILPQQVAAELASIVLIFTSQVWNLVFAWYQSLKTRHSPLSGGAAGGPGLPRGMNLAAVLLMLMGTQWYLLFNIIAGAMAIPKDLQYTAVLLQLNRGERWRVLILPALFPYLVTSAITASGGAWNASIVAECFDGGGQPRSITGVGALITEATAAGMYPLLLASTFAMIVAVTMINRLVWRRLYRLAEARHRLE